MWTKNFQMFKLDLDKAEEPKIKCPKSTGSLKKAREFQKNIYFCFIAFTKAFDCVDNKKKTVENSSRDCNTRPSYLPPVKSVCKSWSHSWTRHGTVGLLPNWEQIRQGCILSPCLFNFYAEYIMRNAELDEAQAGIKISRRSIITSDIEMTPPLWQKSKRN